MYILKICPTSPFRLKINIFILSLELKKMCEHYCFMNTAAEVE